MTDPEQVLKQGHPDAHFKGTDSDVYPGLVGTSYKQMMEEMGERYERG